MSFRQTPRYRTRFPVSRTHDISIADDVYFRNTAEFRTQKYEPRIPRPYPSGKFSKGRGISVIIGGPETPAERQLSPQRISVDSDSHTRGLSEMRASVKPNSRVKYYAMDTRAHGPNRKWAIDNYIKLSAQRFTPDGRLDFPYFRELGRRFRRLRRRTR